MTPATKKLLEEFDRRLALAPYDLPHNDDLVAIANYLFSELDRREQSE